MTLERTVIALGFFDGVHRGHGALLQRTVERARELGAIPAVFTFDRPPKEVVTGQPGAPHQLRRRTGPDLIRAAVRHPAGDRGPL